MRNEWATREDSRSKTVVSTPDWSATELDGVYGRRVERIVLHRIGVTKEEAAWSHL